MACFNGDAGTDAHRCMWPQFGGFQRKQVIAKIFAGMSDDRRAGGWVKEFHAKHVLMVKPDGERAGRSGR